MEAEPHQDEDINISGSTTCNKIIVRPTTGRTIGSFKLFADSGDCAFGCAFW